MMVVPISAGVISLKDPDNKKYIKLGVTGVAVIVVSLLFFFLMFRLPELSRFLAVVAGILTPFLYGAVIAYVLAPVCNRFEGLLAGIPPLKEKQGLRSALSIMLSLALAVLIIWALVMLVIPQVWESIVAIANAIPGQLANANRWLHRVLEDQPQLQTLWDSVYSTAVEKFNEWMQTGLMPTVNTLITQITTQLAAFFSVLKNLFLGVLISIYFLASRKVFAVQARMALYGVFPRRAASLIEDEFHYADKMFNGFLMGKLVDSAIIGLICFAATSLMGFESAALISVVVGVTNIIPFFGPFIGAIPSALLLLLENPMHCVYFLVFIVILQQVDGNLIGPKILGNTTGLSSFWVLFSILLFGGLWGIVGMIVGVPLFAVIYDIARRLIRFGLKKHGSADLLAEPNKDIAPSGGPEKKE